MDIYIKENYEASKKTELQLKFKILRIIKFKLAQQTVSETTQINDIIAEL